MSTWLRLSVRDGRIPDDGPYEGVPGHLYQPLREWVNSNFGGKFGSYADIDGGPRLMAAVRLPIIPASGRRITVHQVTEALYQHPDLMLDAVDAVLHLEEFQLHTLAALDEILSLSGSVWQVNSDGRRLVRRVDAVAQAAFLDASSRNDLASSELQEAWSAAYGRNFDASDAWDHAIKAA